MKRAPRLVLRGIAVVAAMLFLTALVCLDAVDDTPYFRTRYFEETTARLARATATNVIETGDLFAGFGKARLTPTIHVTPADPANGKFTQIPLAGYGDRHGRPATGVHDELYVKAVAFRVGGETGVMFGVDALIIPREVSDIVTAKLAREFGLGRQQLYFSATHTHCSLGGWGEGIVGEIFAGGFDPGARQWFANSIMAAARQALADLQPARLGEGRFAAPGFIRNRLVGEKGTVDPEFSFAMVRQEGGREAILGSYSAHATVLSGRNMEFSGDYPGQWQREVEAGRPGLMAVFLAGGVGSQGPVPGAREFEGVEKMGGALARETLHQLESLPLTNRVAFGTLGLEVDLPPFNTRITDGIRLRPWISASLLTTHKPSFLQGYLLGTTVWLSTPCDFSGELAREIKDLARARGFNAVVTSFNGDYIGYVIPGKYYHLPGYEPRVMSFYGPYVPDYLDQLLRTLALDLGATSNQQTFRQSPPLPPFSP